MRAPALVWPRRPGGWGAHRAPPWSAQRGPTHPGKAASWACTRGPRRPAARIPRRELRAWDRDADVGEEFPVIARDIVEDLRAALEQFESVALELGGDGDAAA